MHLSLFIEQKLTSYLSAILNALFVRNVVKKKSLYGAYIIIHLDAVAFHSKCY